MVDYIHSSEIDPIKNLLNNFKLNYKNKKFSNDKELIFSTTKYLFMISNSLKI